MLHKLTSENRFEFYSPYIRVFICIYLLKDIFTMWEYNSIIYEGNSFLMPEISSYLNYFNIDILFFREYFYHFYFIYFVLIILFMFGVGRRITPLLLFFALGIIQTLSWLTLNGGDNFIKFLILYFVFIDSYSRFSLQKNKKNKSELSNLLSNLGGYSVCLHFCLIYFISAINKIHADVWFNGIATYYILASERFQGTPWNLSIVQNGFFVTITTYGTILIELLFPFLVWYKSIKYYMLFFAFSLHLGIAIFMMLYDFQILFILVLGFFISNDEWQQIVSKTKFLHKKYFLKT